MLSGAEPVPALILSKRKRKMNDKNCGNCYFGIAPVNPSWTEPSIECHRYPPKQEGNTQRPDPFPFPILQPFEWCGEHKPQRMENKHDKKAS